MHRDYKASDQNLVPVPLPQNPLLPQPPWRDTLAQSRCSASQAGTGQQGQRHVWQPCPPHQQLKLLELADLTY